MFDKPKNSLKHATLKSLRAATVAASAVAVGNASADEGVDAKVGNIQLAAASADLSTPRFRSGVLERIPPNYAMVTREGFEKYVMNALNTRHDTAFIIVATVPDLCGPCRVYEPKLKNFAKERAGDKKLKVVAVRFEDFESAAKFVGVIDKNHTERVAFPHTIFAAPVMDGRAPVNRQFSDYPLGLKNIISRDRAMSSLSGSLSERTIEAQLNETKAFAIRRRN